MGKGGERVTPLEIFQINTRRGYYPNEFIARILENKLTYSLEKVQEKIFSVLDLNRYFFASHPLETQAIKPSDKLLFLLLIPFLIGVFGRHPFRNKFLWTFALVAAILFPGPIYLLVFIPIVFETIGGLWILKRNIF